MRPGALVEWVRRLPPTVADGLLAALVTAIALPSLVVGNPVYSQLGIRFRSTNALAVLLVLAETVPLAWRRRAPVTVMAVSAGASMATLLAGFTPTAADLALIIALYTVAAHTPRPKAVIVAFAGAALAFAEVTISAAKYGHTTWQDYLLFGVEIGATWFLGDLQRRRRGYTAKLERLNRMLEARQSVARELIKRRTRQALAEERGRIARELHDVIAHSVSVMVVQAGAARRVAGTDPEQARDAMTSIEEQGRQALTEMRRLVGMLRKGEGATAPDSESALAPQPSLQQVETLVEQAREGGLRVLLRIEGEVRPLPAAVDLSAYRIVQEALTNVRKHAGTATAQVRLRYGPDELEVRVDDDGRGLAAVRSPRSDADGECEREGEGERDAGHGLLGMRERVALFGGDLRVGPRPGGGFRVEARLPLEGARERERERERAAPWSAS